MAPAASRSGAGVSSTDGASTATATIATRYAAAESSRAFHGPSRACSRRASHTAPIVSAADAATSARYQPVRAPMVSA